MDSSNEHNQERRPDDRPASPEPSFSEINDAPPALERPKHSGPGIASFVIAIVCYVLFVAVVISAAITLKGAVNPDGTVDRDKIEAAATGLQVIGIGLIISVVGTLVGLVVGIVGLTLKNRKKLFAVLGTVFNGLAVLLMGGMIILGLAFTAMK